MTLKTDSKTKRRGPQRPERPNEKHGGEAGIKALGRGQEFTGPLAVSKQADVLTELQTDGLEAIVERAAVRLQTCSDLFYDAIQAAAQVGDLDALDKYSSRFGWLQSKALSAWEQVKHNKKAQKPALMGVLSDYDNEPNK